jgi:hypothetical protein
MKKIENIEIAMAILNQTKHNSTFFSNMLRNILQQMRVNAALFIKRVLSGTERRFLCEICRIVLFYERAFVIKSIRGKHAARVLQIIAASVVKVPFVQAESARRNEYRCDTERH